jgi:hypothetical protein
MMHTAGRLAEFSGHDTTLMPLYAAMGNLTFNYPGFATAVAFEVYDTAAATTSTGVNDNLFVKVVVAVLDSALPPVDPSVYPIAFTPYAMTCLSANGSQYVTEQGCPLVDLQRFAATQVGAASGSPLIGVDPCYVWPRDLQFNHCEPSDKAIPGLGCATYRSQCVFSACGAGMYMDASFNCHNATSTA